jgi:hypothetical protein
VAGLVSACFYAYWRYRPLAPPLRDSLIGAGLIACSLVLSEFPMLASALEWLRGRPLLAVYHTPLWQVLLLAFGLFALGSGLVWQRRRGSTLSLYVHVTWLLHAGFLAGILVSLGACAGFGDSLTLSATNARLFTFISMKDFSTSASAPSMDPVFREVGTYLDFYLRRNYLLAGYGALLVAALTLGKLSSRYLWPSLMLVATGLVFIIVCSLRYYTEQYWIYIDLFFIGAAVLLICGFIESRQRIGARMWAVALVAALYMTQYPRVVESYPRYNAFLRDRIDLAAHAIHEVPDYAALMRERYGDDFAFMRRVLSDPRLNGSDRGIDLMSKPAIRRLVAANPDAQAAAARSGRY